MNVMLVDDTPSNLNSLKTLFRSLQKEINLNIFTQDDGDKCVKEFRERNDVKG